MATKTQQAEAALNEQLRASAQRRLTYAQSMLADAILALAVQDCNDPIAGKALSAGLRELVEQQLAEAVQDQLNEVRETVNCYVDGGGRD